MLDVFDNIFLLSATLGARSCQVETFYARFRSSLYRDMHSQKASRPERYARLNLFSPDFGHDRWLASNDHAPTGLGI